MGTVEVWEYGVEYCKNVVAVVWECGYCELVSLVRIVVL